jgi:uncharacterized protein DUF4383
VVRRRIKGDEKMTRSEKTHIRVHGLQPGQVLAGLVGLVYLVIGIIGFARTGLSGFAGNEHVMLLGLMINPLHNVVHIVVGLLGLLLATSSGGARAFGWMLLVGYGLVSAWGLMITGVISSNPVSGLGNPLNLNQPDNWLHVTSAALGLIIAIMPARKAVHVSVPPEQVAPVETTATQREDAGTTTATTTPRRRGPWFRSGHAAQ